MERVSDVVRFEYRNWRGEIEFREATPLKFWFGQTDYHPEPQWIMTAFDHDRLADRDFALKDCNFDPERLKG